MRTKLTKSTVRASSRAHFFRFGFSYSLHVHGFKSGINSWKRRSASVWLETRKYNKLT